MKIGICGAHGVGKTTLIEELKKKTNCEIITEVARGCPYPLDENTTFESQRWIFEEQLRMEKFLELYEKNMVLSDRTFIDHSAYVRYGIDTGNIPMHQGHILLKYLRSLYNTYDLIFYVPIEFALVSDGFRNTNEQYQKQIDRLIRYELDTHDIRYYPLSGKLNRRIENALFIITKECF